MISVSWKDLRPKRRTASLVLKSIPAKVVRPIGKLVVAIQVLKILWTS
jgi:hypothetical protein